MNQPSFQEMTQKELQSYVLNHRDDHEAFHAYVDKLHLEAHWVEMPAIESEQDLENYPEFIEHIRRSAKGLPNK